MKKVIFIVLFAGSILHANINIVVSIVPQKTFVEAIGGEKVNTTVMVKQGSSPHTYEPKPSQMIAISNADVYFAIGVEFEKAWLDRFQNQNRAMKIVDASYGIDKIEMQKHSCSCHKHDKHDKHKRKDPHVWTTPQNVKIIAQNIYNTLKKLDNANESYYRANLDRFLQHLDVVDAEIRAILSQGNMKFMVFHPAWGYFAKEYNLIQIPIEVEGKNPKPRELKHLIQKAKKQSVSVVFTSPEFSDKIAKQIANELSIPVVKISPLDEQWSKNLINFAQAITGGQ